MRRHARRTFRLVLLGAELDPRRHHRLLFELDSSIQTVTQSGTDADARLQLTRADPQPAAAMGRDLCHPSLRSQTQTSDAARMTNSASVVTTIYPDARDID